FRSSLQNKQIKLIIAKTSSPDICDSPLYSTSDANHKTLCSPGKENILSEDHSASFDYIDVKEKEILVEGEARAGQQTKLAALTPTRKHSIGNMPLPSKPPSSAIVVANTRRIGKKYH